MFPPISASHLLPSSSKALLLSPTVSPSSILIPASPSPSTSSKSTSAGSLAHSLSRLGIKKGDVVLIFAPNSTYYPVCFLAVAAIGAIVTTCNPVYTVFELSKQVEDSNPKLAITVAELFEKIKTVKFAIHTVGSFRYCKIIQFLGL